MEQDLMQTQTGGEGNTIQLQDNNAPTPEQFDVKINPIEGEPNKPVPQQATVPTEQESINQQAAQQALMSKGPIPVEPEPPITPEEPQQTITPEETLSPSQIQETVAQQEANQLVNEEESDNVDDIYNKPVDIVEENEEIGSSVKPISEDEIEVPAELNIDPNNPEVLVQTENIQKEIDEYKNTAVTISPDGKVIVNTKLAANKENKPTTTKPTTTTKQTVTKETEVDTEPQEGIYRYGDSKYKYKGGIWYKDVYNDNRYIKIQQNAAARFDVLNKNAVRIGNLPTKGFDGDGLYTYPGNPKAVYKHQYNTWFIDPKGTGNFVKLSKNVKARSLELNKNAVKLGGNKSAVVNVANSILQKTQGNITSFAQNNLVTAGGNVSTTKGLSFNQLTRSNIPGKDEMYTQDGYVNFNYDPNYANASPAAKTIIDASSKLKETKPTTSNLVNTTVLNIGKPTLGSSLNSSIFKVDKNGNLVLDKVALLQNASGINLNNNQLKAELTSSFDKAKNFVDKDIMYMFGEDNTLSAEQREDLIMKQREIKKIIGDGKYDDLKAGAVKKILEDTEEYFNTAKEINTKINEAYSKDMSLDRYALEEKRKDYMNRLNLENNTDFQKYAGETFESTLKIADFIQDGIEDGKLLYDRVNGGYKFSENITPAERKYYEGELSKMITDYNNVQDERFSSVNAEIQKSRSELRFNNAAISNINSRLEKLNPSDPNYKRLLAEKNDLVNSVKSLEKEIDNKESLKSTVFLTEPKKLAGSLNTTNSAKNVFNAIPKEITPKQKFDIFYKNLSEKNNQLAQRNGIDTGSLGELSRGFKDMLDWGGYFSLSDAEKEYVRNIATLNKLAPLYYNNDFGFTQSSAGWYESLWNGIGNILQPVTAEAAGYFSQSKAAGDIQRILEEEGFSKDDIVDDNYINALKEKANVQFWSAENWGNMLGTTVGIIAPLIITKKIPSSALRVAGRVENLVAKTKNVETAALYLKRAEDVFDATLKSTKYGKYLVSPIKTGVEFEITGRVFGSTQDEMYFMSGLTGGLASEAFGALIAKMPSDKAYAYIQNIFGSKTDQAVNIIKKIGEVNARGLGETAEEFGNEFANIYTDELRDKGFFAEVGERFGSLDKVQEFVISTYIMGVGFGIVDVNRQKAAYESLPPAKKKQVDEVLNSVREDINVAESKVDDYVADQTDESERKKRVEKEPEVEVKTTETGGIEFDTDNIEKASEGTPSTVDEARENPSSFSEPIDILNLENYDKENEQGLPSEERKGEEPKQTEPVASTSQEEVSPSGVVQEEQKVTEEQKKSVEKELNEIITPYKEGLERAKDSNDDLMIDFYQKSLDEFDSNPVSFIQKMIESPSTGSQEKALLNTALEGLTKQPAVTETITPISQTETVNAPKTATTEVAPTSGNPFTELESTKNLKGTAKTKAVKDLKQKYGADYNRISKIDTNFASIVRDLEKNNLIEKDCG